MSVYEVIVIGGGVVGSALAYQLVQAGAKTLLIDRQDAGRASDAAAGILSPETGTNDNEDWFELATTAVAYYPQLVANLERDQPHETGYVRCGKLTVAVSQDEVTPFSRAEELIFDRQQQRGTPSPDDLHLVSADQARTLFPLLAQVQRALYYRQAARVDGRLLARAMQRAGVEHGLAVLQADVQRLILKNGAVGGVETTGQPLKAGQVAIAGGAWSQRFAIQLERPVAVEPQRGQIAHLYLRGAETDDWPMISAFHGHYILPWPGGRFVVGATHEYPVGFEPQVTAGGIHEVLEEAIRVAPGLREAELMELRVGLRPRTDDRLPILGRVPGVKGLYIATGHRSTGLQLGPYSAKLVADLMAGRRPAIDLSPFRVERFW